MSFSRFNPFKGVVLIPTVFGVPNLAGILFFDLVFEQNYEFPARVTRKPVEAFGIGVTDAIIIEPEAFSVSAQFTDTPLRILSLVPGGVSPAVGIQGFDRAISLHDRLLNLRDQATPLIIRTTMRVMQNMIIENITSKRDQSSGQTIGVNVNFVKLDVVSSLFVPAQADIDIQALGGAGVSDIQ